MPEQLVDFPKLITVTPYPRKSDFLCEHDAIWKHIHNFRVFSLITDVGDIAGNLGVWYDWDAIYVELYPQPSSEIYQWVVADRELPLQPPYAAAIDRISVSKGELHDNKKALDERLTDMLARSGLALSTSLV